MNSTTVFIVELFLLVAGSVIVGEIVSRFGQAALVGQLAVGIVLGPTLLGPVIGLPTVSAEFTGLQILATFFVLMMAGLAITPEQIYATGVPAAILGVGMFLVPFLGGALVVHYLYPALPWTTEWFVSLTVSITALPVLGVMLTEFNLMKTRFGTYLLNGALVNELGAVTTFSVLLRIRTGPYSPWLDGAIAVISVAVFLSAILAVHYGVRSLRQLHLWGRLVSGVRDTWRSREAGFAFLMVGGLAAALFSQAIGLTFLVGAFYAGLLVTPESAGQREHRQLTRVFDAITWGFFIPLFFALVGLNMNLRDLVTTAPVLLAFVALCLFAFLAKVGVGGAISLGLGWNGSESLGAGFLVASRGAVELAMAVILLSLGIFNATEFTIVAGVGVVTTFLSPIGAGPFVRRVGGASREPPEEGLRPWIGAALPLPSQEEPSRPPLP